MRITLDIPWNRYALIAELAKQLYEVSPQFGKTVLQKLVFLLQEVYKVDCGYDFELYSYGPFDSQLLSDLDLVEHWGCVEVRSVNSGFSGYRICPTDKVDCVREKAVKFLDSPDIKKSIEGLVLRYGKLTAKDLELRATTVYVERNLRDNNTPVTESVITDYVRRIKPKFTDQEIEQAVGELKEINHIQLEKHGPPLFKGHRNN